MTDNAQGARPAVADKPSTSSLVRVLPANRERIVMAGALLLVLVVATAVRLWGLSDRSMTHIEIYVPGIPLPQGLSIPEPRFTVRDILIGLLVNKEPHPPAYYLFMLGWTKLLGSSVLALRLPSVLFGVASVLLLYLFGIQLKQRPAALLAAAMLALNGHQILWSQLAKSYIMACFLGLLSTVLLARLTRKGGRPVGFQLLYAGAVLTGMMTCHWFWALFATHILWILRCQWRSKAIPGLIRLQAAILILGTPLISLAVFQSRRESYLDSSILRGFAEFLQFGYVFEPDSFSVPPIALPAAVAAVLLLLAVVLLVAGLRSNRPEREEVDLVSLGPSWPMMAVGSLLAFLFILRMASFFYGFSPHRTRLVIASSVLPLLIAAGALIMERHWERIGMLITFVTQRATVLLHVLKPLDSLSSFLAIFPAAMTAAVSLVVPLFASRAILLFTPYLTFVLAKGMIALVRHSKYWLALGVVLAVIYPASVLYYQNTRHENPTEYKGLAEQWIPQIEKTDLIFVQPHWATTPIFYYLDYTEYYLFGSDYRTEMRRHPDSRIWVLSFEGLPMTADMAAALTGYQVRRTVEAFQIAATLYEPSAAAGDEAGRQVGPKPVSSAGWSVSFSTYLGGTDQDVIRDATTDSKGNIYLAGGTMSQGFPVTAGAFDTTHNGWMDGFVTKLDAQGRLIWSTFIGGPGYDRAYGIELDAAGNVWIAGRAGRGLPTTVGVVQPNFAGYSLGGGYGDQDAFVCKLRPDGTALIFCSYVGTGPMIRDLALDTAGNAYLAGVQMTDVSSQPPAAWFAHAYQPAPAGDADLVLYKMSPDGTQVLWATYFGGTAEDGSGPSVRVRDDIPTVMIGTWSDDIPTTPGAYQRTRGGKHDAFVVRFTQDGSRLVFATYLGGSEDEWADHHAMALDAAGNVYVSCYTESQDFPTTEAAYDRIYRGGGDVPVAELSADGSMLLAATYLGGAGYDSIASLVLDEQGMVHVFGWTDSVDFPVTADAVQGMIAGGQDLLIAWLAADLSTLQYATYFGGSQDDWARAGIVAVSGNIIAAGWSQSTDWPVVQGVQPSAGGDWDGVVVVLEQQLVATPTPTHTAIPIQTSTPAQTTTATATETAAPTPTATSTMTPGLEDVWIYLPLILARPWLRSI